MPTKRRLKKKVKWTLYATVAAIACLVAYGVASRFFNKKEVSNRHIDGIDVSHYQGHIDWDEVFSKHPTLQFVYVKAIEGSSRPDTNYKYNFNHAKKEGFKVGSYIFYHTMTSPERHFEEFKKLAPKSEQDLIPVVDIETLDHKSPERVRKNLIRLLDLMEDYYGTKPIIYTHEWFYNKYLDCPRINKHKLMIASYNNHKPKVDYCIWQYTETGGLDGINEHHVDLNQFGQGYDINDILLVKN